MAGEQGGGAAVTDQAEVAKAQVRHEATIASVKDAAVTYLTRSLLSEKRLKRGDVEAVAPTPAFDHPFSGQFGESFRDRHAGGRDQCSDILVSQVGIQADPAGFVVGNAEMPRLVEERPCEAQLYRVEAGTEQVATVREESASTSEKTSAKVVFCVMMSNNWLAFIA